MESDKKLVAIVSAPGKIILSGEHAVVYGKDALAIAINLVCSAQVYESQTHQNQLSIKMESFGNVYTFSTNDKLNINNLSFSQYTQLRKGQSHEQMKFQYKCQTFFNQQNIVILPKQYYIQVKSQVPIGKCLGSSASFNTILAASLTFISNPNKPINLEQVNKTSKLFEKIEHGTPSGIDNFVSTFGGMVLFNNSKNPPFKKIQDKKIIQKLIKQIKVLLVDSEIQKNTKLAVEKVRENCQSEKYKSMIEQIGEYPSKILQIVGSDQNEKWWEEVFKICSRNHQLLRQLGVSCPEIEKIVKKYTKEGKSSAKITGAGMGGYVLILSHENQTQIKEGILETKLSEKGLRVTKYTLEDGKEIQNFME